MPEQIERRVQDREQLGRIEGKVDLCLELLTGNGDPSKGLVLMVDRLREKMKLVWGALVFALIAIVKSFWPSP